MPLHTPVSEPIEIHGSLSLSQSILSTTYRKGTAVTANVNGPDLGPVKTGLTFRVPTNGVNSLFPTAQVDLSLPLPVLSNQEDESILSVRPSISAGLRAYLTGLDKADAAEAQAHPYLSAQVAAPLTLPLSPKADFLLTPNVSGLWYPGIEGISLKVNDKDLDGTPDHLEPAAELTFGASTGISFDGTSLTTSWTLDPFDPIAEEGVTSLWGTINVSRQF